MVTFSSPLACEVVRTRIRVDHRDLDSARSTAKSSSLASTLMLSTSTIPNGASSQRLNFAREATLSSLATRLLDAASGV